MNGIDQWRTRFSSQWRDLDAPFRQHAVAFAVVVTLLVILDIATGAPYWAHWVVLGWGAGLGLHYWLANRA